MRWRSEAARSVSSSAASKPWGRSPRLTNPRSTRRGLDMTRWSSEKARSLPESPCGGGSRPPASTSAEETELGGRPPLVTDPGSIQPAPDALARASVQEPPSGGALWAVASSTLLLHLSVGPPLLELPVASRREAGPGQSPSGSQASSLRRRGWSGDAGASASPSASMDVVNLMLGVVVNLGCTSREVKPCPSASPDSASLR
mmetsp:Transcript_5751/g.18147  ORF Transcript_5751/g.18147 Transcript_5751/m.18147 type:complete len:202 (-) Transcript_5751:1191-1796(-)